MRRTVLLLVSTTIAVLLASGVAFALPSSTPDSGTPQTNGRVTAVLAAGGRIYLGGNFTEVDGSPRNHLAALDAATGQLTGWNPGADGGVRALAVSADGATVYAGGDFTAVGGAARQRLAALDVATGAPKAWAPKANYAVDTLAVSGNRVYLGGGFTTINGKTRNHLALVDATSGALDPNFAAAADGAVKALALSPDGARLYAGGKFATINGQSKPFLGAMSPTTGALDGTFRPPKPNGNVFELRASGTRIYTAEGGMGGMAAAYDGTKGARAWSVAGDGDVQALTVMGGKVYLGGHFVNFGGQARNQFAAVDAATGALDPNWTPGASRGSASCTAWLPSTCGSGVWELAADPVLGRLYAGGDFRKVSGLTHTGFARFS